MPGAWCSRARNAGKLREFSELLGATGLELARQSDFGIAPPPETGVTFLENALIKARNAARLARLPAIADDSGLEVDALGGAPGVYSARYAGEDASDEANLDKLLGALEDVPPAHRTARYRCVDRVSSKAPRIRSRWWARAPGKAASSTRAAGSGGFGYDPSFVPTRRDAHRRQKCPQHEKHAHSHRGQALRAFLAQFRRERVRENAAARACTRTSPGACRNARTAISIRTRCAKRCPRIATSMRCCATWMRRLAQVAGRPLVSIFLGGGTPSLFSPAAIGRLLESCARHARIRRRRRRSRSRRIPAPSSAADSAEYRAAGMTRVSLGAQSFDARQLKLLGRIHSADETRRAAEELHAAGLDNFNLDLMYALPGQSAADAEADVTAALALAPAHLSQYHLTIEPGTVFAAAPPVQPADEIVEEMLERSLQRLREAGFEQYEVSGYARAGRALRPQSQLLELRRLPRHRSRCARQDFRSLARTRGSARSRRASRGATSPRIRRALVRKPIAVRDLPFEFAMNGFRLVEGFDDDLFEARTGLSIAVLERALAPLVARGLVERGSASAGAQRPKGFRFLNEILVELLPDAEVHAGGVIAQCARTWAVLCTDAHRRARQTMGLRQVSVLLHDK